MKKAAEDVTTYPEQDPVRSIFSAKPRFGDGFSNLPELKSTPQELKGHKMSVETIDTKP